MAVLVDDPAETVLSLHVEAIAIGEQALAGRDGDTDLRVPATLAGARLARYSRHRGVALLDEHATTSAVLAALPNATWAHLGLLHR